MELKVHKVIKFIKLHTFNFKLVTFNPSARRERV